MSNLPKVTTWATLDDSQRNALLDRPALEDSDEIRATVRKIINVVRDEGDTAVRRLTRDLDGVDVDHGVVRDRDVQRDDDELDQDAGVEDPRRQQVERDREHKSTVELNDKCNFFDNSLKANNGGFVCVSDRQNNSSLT